MNPIKSLLARHGHVSLRVAPLTFESLLHSTTFKNCLEFAGQEICNSMKTKTLLLTLSMFLAALAVHPASAGVVPSLSVANTEKVGTVSATDGAMATSLNPGWSTGLKSICNTDRTLLQADWSLGESRQFSLGQVRKAEFGMTITPLSTNVPTSTSHFETFTTATTATSTASTSPQFALPSGLPGDVYTVRLYGKFWEDSLSNQPTTTVTSASTTVVYVDCSLQFDSYCMCSTTNTTCNVLCMPLAALDFGVPRAVVLVECPYVTSPANDTQCVGLVLPLATGLVPIVVPPLVAFATCLQDHGYKYCYTG